MITVKEFTTAEINNYNELKYNEFLDYYFNTELKVRDIFKVIGLNEKNSAGKYIRKKLLADGYNANKRIWSIKKGTWISEKS